MEIIEDAKVNEKLKLLREECRRRFAVAQTGAKADKAIDDALEQAYELGYKDGANRQHQLTDSREAAK